MPITVSDAQMHARVQEKIKEGVSLGMNHWRTTPKLNSLYVLCSRRKGANGKSFFGHGNWYRYLEEVHNVLPVDYPRLPAAAGAHSPFSRMSSEEFIRYARALANARLETPGAASRPSRKPWKPLGRAISPTLAAHVSDLLERHGRGELLGNPLLIGTFKAHGLTLYQIGTVLDMKEQSVGRISRELERLRDVKHT